MIKSAMSSAAEREAYSHSDLFLAARGALGYSVFRPETLVHVSNVKQSRFSSEPRRPGTHVYCCQYLSALFARRCMEDSSSLSLVYFEISSVTV